MTIPYSIILVTVVTATITVNSWAQNTRSDTTGRQLPATNDTLVFSRTDTMRQVTVTAAKNNLQVENGRILMNFNNSTLATGSSYAGIGGHKLFAVSFSPGG